MIKRTLEISREPAHLAVRYDQLLIQRNGETVGQAPCEDVGVVVVDHPQTTYTHHALMKLAESEAVVVICGPDHLPAALLLPLAEHSQVVSRLNVQLAVSRPLQKQLWKQVVVAKVEAQARNLPVESAAHRKLLALAREVRSGDPMNIEAQAARVYWQNWLWEEEERAEGRGQRAVNERDLAVGGSAGSGDPRTASEGSGSGDPRTASESSGSGDPRTATVASPSPSPSPADGGGGIRFRRDPDGAGLNSFLNYGYAVVRAAVARAIVAAGLLPSLGIHHRNRSNTFCLADDLVEPLRPLVDDRVREMHRQGYEELNQPAKAELLELLTTPMELGGQTGPLMVMLHRYVASLVRCFGGEAKRLEIPVACEEVGSGQKAAGSEEEEVCPFPADGRGG